MKASRTLVRSWAPGLVIVALWMPPASLGRGAEGDSSPVVAPPLPPPAPGRTVIADVPTVVFAVQAGQRQLKDFDAEESAVIAQINRSPSTWQTYLLYTSEDLPERLFMPGFTFVLGSPKKREARRLADEKAAAASTPALAAGPTPGN